MEIVCNFRKCRKQLTTKAWVTTCSHAFCVEHGKKEFKRNSSNALICPACQSELGEKYDVIQADLKPCEAFKSIVLAGMKPDIIMDIAMRGISFWSYQAQQEIMYHEHHAKHARDSMEQMVNMNTQKIRIELDACNRKINSLQNECNKKRKQTEELTAKLEEKNRKLESLTNYIKQQEDNMRKSENLATYLKYQKKRPSFTDTDDENMRRPQKISSHLKLPRRSSRVDAEEEIGSCHDEIINLVSNRAASDAFVFRPFKDPDEKKICSPQTPMFDFRKHSKNTRNKSHFQFKPVES